MKEKIIKTAKIGPYPKDIIDSKMPEVLVTYEDGTEEEFIGKTREEAKRMKFEKDREWVKE